MIAARANFLNESQVYEFALPPGCITAPEQTSVLKTAGALREITYRSHGRGQGPAEQAGITHRFDIVGPSGKVEVYSPNDGSPTLMAMWRLKNGTLQTFVDDQVACGSDLEAELTEVVQALTVRESSGGMPLLETSGPVAWSDPRDQFHLQAVFFPPSDGNSWPAVTLTREPAWAREGTSSLRMTERVRKVGVTNLLQVTAHVSGPPSQEGDLRNYAKQVAESMVPLP